MFSDWIWWTTNVEHVLDVTAWTPFGTYMSQALLNSAKMSEWEPRQKTFIKIHIINCSMWLCTAGVLILNQMCGRTEAKTAHLVVKQEVKTSSRSPHRPGEHMFFKIWLSESMSKNGTFLKTLECTTAVLSSHRKAWPVRRAEGRHTWVPSYFKQTPMCLMICSTSAGCQVRTTDCTGVRSSEHHPPCKSAWKTNPGFSRDLIKQTEILILCSKKGLDV